MSQFQQPAPTSSGPPAQRLRPLPWWERGLVGLGAVSLGAGAAFMTLLFAFFLMLMLDPICTEDAPSLLEGLAFVGAGGALGWSWSLAASLLLVATRGRGIARRRWWIAPVALLAVAVASLAATGTVSYDGPADANCLHS